MLRVSVFGPNVQDFVGILRIGLNFMLWVSAFGSNFQDLVRPFKNWVEFHVVGVSIWVELSGVGLNF